MPQKRPKTAKKPADQPEAITDTPKQTVPRYRGYLGLDWYKKDKAILLIGDDDMKKETDEKIPAPRLHWVNEDGALFYEIDEAEGKGKKPYWVDRHDIRVREPRPLIFQKGFVVEEKKKSGDLFQKAFTVKETKDRDDSVPNMLIRGDNLLALNTLVKIYENKPDEERPKCIYIDPPYNTGSAFEHYDDNLEHSQWLTLIRDRLQLLRCLLRDDGLIWISIDEEHIHLMRMLCDEIFGQQNLISTFVWKKSYGGGAKSKYVVNLHEYILAYGKNIESLPELFLPADPEAVGKYYKYKDNKFEKRGPYRLQPLATTSMDERPNLRYPISAPDGTKIMPEKQWQWSRDRVEAAIKDDRIVFNKKDSTYTVSYKQYLKDEEGNERLRKPYSIIENIYTQHGTYESMELFGLEEKFSFPKPEELIQMIITISSSEGELVLDAFAGSGTTLAVAQKMGRRYIGVEIGKHADTHIIPRLKKVLSGEDQGGISKAINWHGGGGFQYFHLGDSILAANGKDFNWKLDAVHISESLLYYFDFVHDPAIKLAGMVAGFNAESESAGIVCVKDQAKDRSMMVSELEIEAAVSAVRKVHGNCSVKFITNCSHQIPGALEAVSAVSVPSEIVIDLE